MRKAMKKILLTTVIFAVTALPGRADWPQYLGPNRNAMAPRVKIAKGWGADGPKQLWSIPLGAGFGGASIHGGDIFVLDRDGETGDVLRCLDLESGAEKWNFAYAAPGKHPYPGSRTVPTVDADYVWTVGPFGHMHCLDRKTREVVWKKNILEDFDAKKPGWGVAQSPLLYKDMVIVAPQGKKAGLAAFDKKTGEVRWTSRKLSGNPCHVSPVLATLGGVDQFIMISPYDKKDASITNEVVSFDAATGETLWTYAGLYSFMAIAPVTVIDERRIFLTNCAYNDNYDPVSIMLRITREAGAYTVEELFKTEEAGSKIHPPVLQNGYLYLNGGGKPYGMRCLSLEGKVMWRDAPNFGLGAMILAGGLILNQNGGNGDLHLIEPGPEGYKELARAQLFNAKKSTPWAPLAFSDGKLLIRDTERMLCLDLGAN